MKKAPLILSFLAMTACETVAPAPTPAQLEIAQKRWPSATMPNLTEGRRIFVNERSGCHNLPSAADLPADEWPTVIHEMGSEYAKIPQSEIDLITQYIVSVRETPATKSEN